MLRHTPFPLDSATLKRMVAEARRHDTPELIVISLAVSTELAAELADRTPGLQLIATPDEAEIETAFAAALEQIVA